MGKQIPPGTTHIDEYGNFYKSLTGVPTSYCVYYWHNSNQWFQDLGKDFNHLVKL